MTSSPSLFAPARVGGLELPNRLVMAPMTRTRADADGVPGPLMATYYAQRAGAGLIVAEATTPSAVGRTYPHIPGIHSAAQVAGWRTVTEAVGAAGGRMVLQLQHGGRVGHPATSGHTPLAPSAIALPGTIMTPDGHLPAVEPRAMTAADIRATVADFAAAARNAVAAGFHGVEVHSANGYLLHQFLAQNTNHRTDGYGGPVAARIRFTVEVVAAVVEAIGADRVGVRLSPGWRAEGIEEGDTEAIYPPLVAELARLAPASLHLVQADPDQPLFAGIRRAWPGTLIANPASSHRSIPADGGLASATRLLTAGADLVSLGRLFLINPDLVERLRTGAPVSQALRGDRLLYVRGAEGYTDYPALAATAR
jgi:N-ethylmaleimide reductase